MTAKTKPRFTVIQYLPHYCDRDGIAFYEGRLIAATMTEGWARQIASRHDSEGWDESYVEVRDGDHCRIARPVRAPDPIGTDECPF